MSAEPFSDRGHVAEEGPVRFLLLSGVFLAVLGWAWFLLSYQRTHQLRVRGLFPTGPSFEDLYVYLTRFEVFRRPEFFVPVSSGIPRSQFAYPPGAALCYRFLYRWRNETAAFITVCLLWWGAVVAYTLQALRKAHASLPVLLGVPALCVMSYPIWFLFQRGNIEVFLWALLFLSALAYSRGHLYLAAVGIGLAASIKLYPILLLGLFLKHRREWTALAAGLVTALLATVVEIWRCAPGFFWYGAHGFFGGVAQFQSKYAGSTQAGNGEFDHSLFGWVKAAAMRLGLDPRSATKPYYLVCGGLALLVYLVWVRQKPFLNRLTFLLVLMVLLPPVSFTYTLVHLYLPLLLLILAMLQGSPVSPAARTTQGVALACLLSLMLPIDIVGPLVRSGGKLQVLPLLVLLWAAARTSWGKGGAEQQKGAPAERPASLAASSAA